MSTRRISADAGWCVPSRLPRGPNGRPLCRQCGAEVPGGRRSFCGKACVDAWRIKTDPGHVRTLVYARDHGICRICGHQCGKRDWQADHIVPVVEGGGECGLDGYRTLCIACHKKETAALAARRAEQRTQEKAAKRIEEASRTGFRFQEAPRAAKPTKRCPVEKDQAPPSLFTGVP